MQPEHGRLRNVRGDYMDIGGSRRIGFEVLVGDEAEGRF